MAHPKEVSVCDRLNSPCSAAKSINIPSDAVQTTQLNCWLLHLQLDETLKVTVSYEKERKDKKSCELRQLKKITRVATRKGKNKLDFEFSLFF